MMKLSKLTASGEGRRKSIQLEINNLARIKLIAMRQGVWFKVLNRLERGLLDLSLKVIKKIRSKVLAISILSITEKILNALKNKVRLCMWQIGAPIAEKISQIAQKWGHRTAYEWANNPGFIWYLTIIKVNSHPSIA